MMMSSCRGFDKDLKGAMGDNSFNHNRNAKCKNDITKIYIGNISNETSLEEIKKFLGHINMINFKLLNRKNKTFAFADLPNMQEVQKAIELYDEKNYMGYKLHVKLAGTQNKKPDSLSGMPKLEDINDDDGDYDVDDGENSVVGTQSDILSFKSSKTNIPCTDNNKYLEDVINVQPDRTGLFSFSIARKDCPLKTNQEVKEKLSPFGPVSNVFILPDSIIVKVPSRQQVVNIFKALGQELNIFIGTLSLNLFQNTNKTGSCCYVSRFYLSNHVSIYIGNIAVESRAEILKFFGDVEIISLKLFSRFNKVFGFAELPNLKEAERAVEMYNQKIFRGNKLVVRLSDNNSNNNAKKPEILSEMPKLEDIENDANGSPSEHKSFNGKIFSSYPTSKSMENDQNKTGFSRNCFEDSLNIQPDSSGFFSLHLNRKDLNFKCENAVKNVFMPYGFVSNVSFSDDTIVVKMPVKEQAINAFKALGKELNLSIGNNSMETKKTENVENNSNKQIYIGNLNSKVTKPKLMKFLGEIKINSLKILSKNNKFFAFADLPNSEETEKAIQMYNNKPYMGFRLIVRLAENQHKKVVTNPEMHKPEDVEVNKNELISEMPKLVEMEDDDDSTNSSTLSQPNCNYDQIANRRLVSDWISKQNSYPSKYHDDQPIDPPPENQFTLLIGNFPMAMSEERLLFLFKDFHPSGVNIINNSNPKRSTQALMTFCDQKDSENAIEKFDKVSYAKCNLLVTSISSCPCQREFKDLHKKNRAMSQDHQQQQQPNHIPNPKKENKVQEKGKNCNSINSSNSSNHMTSNKKPFKSSPTPTPCNTENKTTDFLQNKENSLVPISPIDVMLKKEAEKMAILIKDFQIQPYFSSDSLQVMVTSVINEELFWGNVFSSFNNDLTEFMALHNELQSAALSLPKYVLSKKDMKCVALFQGDWYRAWILDPVEKEVVKVLFLDYGNISNVSLKDVRSSNESTIWKLPPKARAFRLSCDSKKLPENAENQFIYLKICKPGKMANGFISIVSLVPH